MGFCLSLVDDSWDSFRIVEVAELLCDLSLLKSTTNSILELNQLAWLTLCFFQGREGYSSGIIDVGLESC